MKMTSHGQFFSLKRDVGPKERYSRISVTIVIRKFRAPFVKTQTILLGKSNQRINYQSGLLNKGAQW